MANVLERKRVKFYRDGGSRKITVSKAWLRRLGMEDAEEGDLVLTDEGITLTPIEATDSRSIEDEPEFALFMSFLAKRALAHPEALSDAADFHARDAGLIAR